MKNITIESAKQFLKDNGYYIDNLWTVHDVKSKYECSDEQAQKVLNNVLGGEWICGEINTSIDITAEDLNLSKRVSKYFLVSGYWKDSKEKFEEYIIKEFDYDEGFDEYEDENIFFYGLSEEEINKHIELKNKS